MPEHLLTLHTYCGCVHVDLTVLNQWSEDFDIALNSSTEIIIIIIIIIIIMAQWVWER